MIIEVRRVLSDFFLGEVGLRRELREIITLEGYPPGVQGFLVDGLKTVKSLSLSRKLDLTPDEEFIFVVLLAKKSMRSRLDNFAKPLP